MAEITMTKAPTPAEAGPATKAESTNDLAWYVPRADIYEHKDGLVVLLDMPGVAETGVSVDLEGGVLSVTGHLTPGGHGSRRLIHSEYEIGNYQRSFTLSEDVSKSGIEASMRNGTLQIYLPKAAEVKPRQIPVKAG